MGLLLEVVNLTYMPEIGLADGDTVMNKFVVDTANSHLVSTYPFALVES